MSDDDLASWIPWVRKVAQGIDYGTAEDLAQEGMIALWQAWRVHDASRGPLNYWLKYKARYHMLTVWKRGLQRTHGDVTDDAGVLDRPHHVDWESATERAMVTSHRQEIHTAISELTPQQQAYVRLRWWEEATWTERRAVFGYDADSLFHSSKNGARKKLRKTLARLA